jgi:hypothetical protein
MWNVPLKAVTFYRLSNGSTDFVPLRALGEAEEPTAALPRAPVCDC